MAINLLAGPWLALESSPGAGCRALLRVPVLRDPLSRFDPVLVPAIDDQNGLSDVVHRIPRSNPYLFARERSTAMFGSGKQRGASAGADELKTPAGCEPAIPQAKPRDGRLHPESSFGSRWPNPPGSMWRGRVTPTQLFAPARSQRGGGGRSYPSRQCGSTEIASWAENASSMTGSSTAL
jgi:hypothetical protein